MRSKKALIGTGGALTALAGLGVAALTLGAPDAATPLQPAADTIETQTQIVSTTEHRTKRLRAARHDDGRVVLRAVDSSAPPTQPPATAPVTQEPVTQPTQAPVVTTGNEDLGDDHGADAGNETGDDHGGGQAESGDDDGGHGLRGRGGSEDQSGSGGDDRAESQDD
jgi:hypothetical protein